MINKVKLKIEMSWVFYFFVIITFFGHIFNIEKDNIHSPDWACNNIGEGSSGGKIQYIPANS